jgi:hypothetical protein
MTCTDHAVPTNTPYLSFENLAKTNFTFPPVKSLLSTLAYFSIFLIRKILCHLTWSYQMNRLIGLSLILSELAYLNTFDLSKQPKSRSIERYRVIAIVLEASAFNGNGKLSTSS